MSTGKLRDLTEGEIADMLKLLDAGDRDMWVRMAMAVKSELGDAGFDVWDQWSRTDTKGYSSSAAKATWKSAKIGPVTVGSLVHEAKRLGYVIDNEDVPQLSEEQIAEREATRKAVRQQQEKMIKAEQKRARDQANNIWENAQPCDEHPYLSRKRIQSYGLRVGNWPVKKKDSNEVFQKPNRLLIPIMSADGVTHSLQAISPEKPETGSDRYYLPGGKKSGCFYIIHGAADVKVVAYCEGYATGATIHQLTGWTVIVCFDAGNITNVMDDTREMFRGKTLLVVGDNDRWTTKPVNNPGKTNAKKCANTFNCLWMVPEFLPETLAANTFTTKNPDTGEEKTKGPTDINDLFCLEPVDNARGQLLAAVAPKTPAPATAPEQDKKPVAKDADYERPHFKALGYNKGRYFYLSTSTAQIVELTPTAHSKANLLQLAPLSYWEFEYGGRSGINWDRAMDDLMQACKDARIFSPDVIRGRGAWVDKGRSVFHFGDHLLVNGEELETWEIESRNVYERLRSLNVDKAEPMTSEEGTLLVATAGLFQWQREESAILLAGFIALAPICGALSWRPHAWITGGPGSGKSTVFEKFAKPLLSSICVYAQGASSEAGIRQELKGDALPVLFDESEQNSERESQRVQAIIAMIRQSSSDSQAKTLKGTATGESVSYLIRSMFLLASIQVGLKHQADVERLSVLTLKSKEQRTDDATEWEALRETLHSIETDPTISARLLWRILKLQPITMRNISTFKRVASRRFGTVRDGDQYGTLIAGAYSLMHDDEVDEDRALAFINSFPWGQLREVEAIDEGETVLQTILGYTVRLPNGLSTTIYRLWMESRGVKQEALGITKGEAKALLEAMNIRGDGLYLAIGNSEQLARAFSKTPYAADWRGLLSRMEGVERSKPVKVNGRTAKCVVIPFALVDENNQLSF